MRGNKWDPSGDDVDLSQFAKNRFFEGKLMTPQVMESEREYHTERLQTLARHLFGSGIVRGLGVDSPSDTDDGLEVTIEPGLALDGYGRPIVVDQPTTTSLPPANGDELYLFLEYDESAVEPVPVPESNGSGETVPNRLVERFELTHRESPPEESSILPDVDAIVEDDAAPETICRRLVDQYHDRHRRDVSADRDPAVYLGGFERTGSTGWSANPDAPSPRYVYDPQLLFGLLGAHLTDTDNPHQTPVTEPMESPPDDVEALNERMAKLESTVDALAEERRTVVRYTLRKTINDRRRFFNALSDRLEPHSGAGSRLAREVALSSSDDVFDEEETEAAYRVQLDDVLERAIEISDELDGVATESSHETYLQAVSALQETLEGDASLIDVVDADDTLSEAADSVETLVDVVPDQ
ncbi:hypothetical protein [Natranaeroarchaeum aerophilus]|uniref:Uncharacterized protein n=1 Tax=Natranaeroarchaeum aerophilus TaxID=2917711 RepID=A0AAE3K5T6_9EURY|nr:hypothetical protein [Natranaeroarchaeum aerophilus]MCL9812054.1 hypothetical protein [Natranaeroarchaeum aerophilus]